MISKKNKFQNSTIRLACLVPLFLHRFNVILTWRRHLRLLLEIWLALNGFIALAQPNWRPGSFDNNKTTSGSWSRHSRSNIYFRRQHTETLTSASISELSVLGIYFVARICTYVHNPNECRRNHIGVLRQFRPSYCTRLECFRTFCGESRARSTSRRTESGNSRKSIIPTRCL